MVNTISTCPAAFESAAQAFLACARDALEGGSVKYKSYYQLAAQCFEEAGNAIQAAENYRIAGDFTKAVLLFKESGKFDDVYDVITNHNDKVASEVLESVKFQRCYTVILPHRKKISVGYLWIFYVYPL
jgi:hypothetical protein